MCIEPQVTKDLLGNPHARDNVELVSYNSLCCYCPFGCSCLRQTEQTRVKDLEIVFYQMPFLTQPRLELVVKKLQDCNTDHRASQTPQAVIFWGLSKFLGLSNCWLVFYLKLNNSLLNYTYVAFIITSNMSWLYSLSPRCSMCMLPLHVWSIWSPEFWTMMLKDKPGSGRWKNSRFPLSWSVQKTVWDIMERGARCLSAESSKSSKT